MNRMHLIDCFDCEMKLVLLRNSFHIYIYTHIYMHTHALLLFFKKINFSSEDRNTVRPCHGLF